VGERETAEDQLGISDELPPDADIERVRAVGELVADIQ